MPKFDNLLVSTYGNPISVGVIGAGNITNRIHAPLITKHSDCELFFIADIDDKCKSVADYYNTQGIVINGAEDVPQCDVAILAIPPGVRDAYHQEFAARETPVFAEKPFAINLEEHKKYLTTGNLLFCNYMRTCFSSTRQLRSIIETGSFGQLQQMNIIEEGKVGATGLGKDTLKADSDITGGGVIFERGSHTLSQIFFLMQGWDWKVQSADVEWYDDIDIEVSAEIEASTGDRTVPLYYRQSRSRPIGNQIQCLFENAILLHDHTDPEDQITIIPRQSSQAAKINFNLSPASIHRTDCINREQKLAPAESWAMDHNEAFYLRWQEFLSYIRSNNHTTKKPMIKTGLNVTTAISEIYELAN